MNKEQRKHTLKVRNITLSLLLIIGFLFQNSSVKAQTATSSPYSRYGIGNVNNRSNGQSFAMGGTGIALQNDTIPMFFINTANPASYSSIRLTTADIGINYTRMQLQNTTDKQTLNSAALGYISLAFPIKKWWGASVGLVPFSSVGYKVTDEKLIDFVGKAEYLYEGKGGVNQLYFGNGFKPLYGLPRMFLRSEKYRRLASKSYADNTPKSDSAYRADQYRIKQILKSKKSWQAFSIGFNASYLFGQIDHSRKDIFASNSGSYNTSSATTTRFSDVYLDYGVQYAKVLDSLRGRDLKENVKWMVGATFAAQSNLNAKIDTLSYNYYYNSGGYEIIRDTIENIQDSKGKVTFPLSFGVGAAFKKGERWTVAADFAMQNWSSYSAFNQTGGLKNSMRVSLGMQWIPNPKAGQGKYLSRVNYRLGGRYAQTALELKSSQLTETAVTIGFGFPVGRNYLLQNFSMINIGVEAGQRGTINNGLIKESFIKATIGFTINDRWFVKPKYD